MKGAPLGKKRRFLGGFIKQKKHRCYCAKGETPHKPKNFQKGHPLTGGGEIHNFGESLTPQNPSGGNREHFPGGEE